MFGQRRANQDFVKHLQHTTCKCLFYDKFADIIRETQARNKRPTHDLRPDKTFRNEEHETIKQPTQAWTNSDGINRAKKNCDYATIGRTRHSTRTQTLVHK